MRENRTSGSMRGCRKRATFAARLRPTLPEPPIRQCSSSELARSWPYAPAPVQIRRRSVLQALMRAFVIVELEVTADARPSLRHQPVIPQVHLFVFQRAPQSFDEDVVQTSPAPVHADSDIPFFQHAGELLTGELRPLIAVEDLRAPPTERPFHS